MTERLALFPLDMVLFPRAVVPLRIFEPRYLDMVSRSLKEDSKFGLCMNKSSHSEYLMQRIYPVGTSAKIINWEGLSGGLLGVLAEGQERFMVHNITVQKDGLWVADVKFLPAVTNPNPQLPNKYHHLSMLLEKILERIQTIQESDWLLDDSEWVSSQLATLLPFDDDVKQKCLEIDNVMERLQYLLEITKKLGWM